MVVVTICSICVHAFLGAGAQILSVHAWLPTTAAGCTGQPAAQTKAHLGPDAVSPHQDVSLVALPTLQDGPDAALAKLIHLRQAGQAPFDNQSICFCKISTTHTAR